MSGHECAKVEIEIANLHRSTSLKISEAYVIETDTIENWRSQCTPGEDPGLKCKELDGIVGGATLFYSIAVEEYPREGNNMLRDKHIFVEAHRLFAPAHSAGLARERAADFLRELVARKLGSAYAGSRTVHLGSELNYEHDRALWGQVCRAIESLRGPVRNFDIKKVVIERGATTPRGDEASEPDGERYEIIPE